MCPILTMNNDKMRIRLIKSMMKVLNPLVKLYTGHRRVILLTLFFLATIIIVTLVVFIIPKKSQVVNNSVEIFSPDLYTRGSGRLDTFLFNQHRYDTSENLLYSDISMLELPFTLLDTIKVFQGDIILGPSYRQLPDSVVEMYDEIEQFKNAAPFAEITQTEILRQKVRVKAVGQKLPNYLWLDKVIPYKISSTLNSDSVKKAIHLWDSKLEGLIRFIEINGDEPASYVFFIRASGYSSPVGKVTGIQNVTVDATNDVGQIAHEIGHVLGLWHEHSHPERDRYIIIHKENILEEDSEQFVLKSIDDVEVNNYDFGSIMHYSEAAFSKNPSAGLKTIELLPAYRNSGIILGQRYGPSDRDIALIRKLYNH